MSLDVDRANNVTIQMGAFDYGIPIEGILGLDFLLQVEARIDFKAMIISND